MLTLQNLTPEIRQKIPEYISKCIDNLYNGTEHAEYKRINTSIYIQKIYSIGSLKEKPIVIVANTIKEYIKFYRLIFKSEQFNDVISSMSADLQNLDMEKTVSLEQSLEQKLRKEVVNFTDKIQIPSHSLFLISQYNRGYLMWYKFLKDEFKLECKKGELLDWLYANVNSSSIMKAYLTDKVVLVLRMPIRIKKNEIGFHSVDNEGAIIYEDLKMHFINGRRVPDWIFAKYFEGELTFKEFSELENEDDKASVITLIKENEGNEGVLKFLDAKLVDEQVVDHENGYSEKVSLYKSKSKYSFLQNSKGEMDQPYAWLRLVCPSTNQVYLIDTCPTFTHAVSCAKWHRPKQVPESVDYKWQSAN